MTTIRNLLKRVLDTQERIECELRWVRHKLDQLGEADYSKEDLELYAVPDAVDKEILQRLLEVGVDGVLPKTWPLRSTDGVAIV